ncbi:hypothetical protein KCU99_g9362, partial [Aureobasidium melanogenum]
MDPFDPHSIARSNAERTLSQRRQREGEWLMRLNPHLSNDQLRSWTDVAEELLTQGFEGNYGQTQRMARAQAEQSEEHAEEPQFTVDEPHGRAQQSPEHVQQSPEHAEEPQSAADESHYSTQHSHQQAKELRSTVDESPEHAQQSFGHAEEDDEEASGESEEPDQQSPEENTPLESHMARNAEDKFSRIPKTPTAMTPANPTTSAAVPSQSTLAPIITFGAAAPTTSVVSTKPINRRTANDYAGTSGMVYSCPVAECEQPMNEAYTIERFYKHLDEALHTDYFYQKNTYQSLCKESNALLAGLEACKQCNNGNNFSDIIGALNHFEDDHEDLKTRAGSRYVCDPYDIAFPTKELLWGHLAL